MARAQLPGFPSCQLRFAFSVPPFSVWHWVGRWRPHRLNPWPRRCSLPLRIASRLSLNHAPHRLPPDPVFPLSRAVSAVTSAVYQAGFGPEGGGYKSPINAGFFRYINRPGSGGPYVCGPDRPRAWRGRGSMGVLVRGRWLKEKGPGFPGLACTTCCSGLWCSC